MKSLFRNLMLGIGLAVATLVATPHAWGADKVTLKDGTVLEGEIVREDKGLVWMNVKVGGVSVERLLTSGEIKGIERSVGAGTPKAEPKADPKAEPKPQGEPASAPATDAKDQAATETATPAASPASSGRKVPRAVVLTMGDKAVGDMVGVYMTAEAIRRAIPMIEKEIGNDGTGVLVLRIDSGGGYGAEVPKISDLIENELKPKFRVVGWIAYATSAAAMAAHSIEEIYFTTRGQYGSCTGFYGSADRPVEGYELQESLAEMEWISSRGEYNTLIMRAMQIQQPLSATLQPDGQVVWFPDAVSGEIVVNRDNEILSFNSGTAEKVKFSRGTADTIEDLTKLMGYEELDWVGEHVKGIAWPISKSEKMQRDFRKKTLDDKNSTNIVFRTYQNRMEAAAGARDRDERVLLVNQAKIQLDRIKQMAKNNFAFIFENFGGEQKNFDTWVKEQEKLIRDMLR
jgi:hypothetical protein